MASSSSSPPPRRRRLRIESSCPPSDSDLEQRLADASLPCPPPSQVLEPCDISKRRSLLRIENSCPPTATDLQQRERERSPPSLKPSEEGSDAERRSAMASARPLHPTALQGLIEGSDLVHDEKSRSSSLESARFPRLCGACQNVYQAGGDCCSRAAAIALRLQQECSSSVAVGMSPVRFCLGIMRGVVSDRESYIRPEYPAIDTRPCKFNSLKPSIQDLDRSSITCRRCSEYRRCELHRFAVVCQHCVRCQLCLHHSWELTSLSGQLHVLADAVHTDA